MVTLRIRSGDALELVIDKSTLRSYSPVMPPQLTPEFSAVHIVEAEPQITIEQTSSIPSLFLIKDVYYSADNYRNPNSTANFVNAQGESIVPPRELLTTNTELKMIIHMFKHLGIISSDTAAKN